MLSLTALVLCGCAGAPKRNADAETKLDYLVMSAEDEAAGGPVECKRYAAALENRLARSPYHYYVQRLYFCSLGTSCHVALKVDTGDGLYAADNGAFIRGNVTTMAHFRKRLEKASVWQPLSEDQASALLLRERFNGAGL